MDFFSEAFKGDTTFGLVLDGEEVPGIHLETLTKIEVTTSWRAKAKIWNHQLSVASKSAACNQVAPDVAINTDKSKHLIGSPVN